MRCLYCGKELALLKRLRGGGDFCSDAHKQSYQEEYNRLALSRLLQAQKKGQTSSSPAQNAPPPPNASVALEEPAPDDAVTARGAAAEVEPVEVEPIEVEDDAANRATEVSVLEDAQTETLAEALPEEAVYSAAAEEFAAQAEVDDETAQSAEPEPTEAAGFLFESPALAEGPEETPYLEPWLELSPGPAMSEWQIQNGAFSLSAADLLSLDLRPNVSTLEHASGTADLAPQAFASAAPDPPSWAAKPKKIAYADRLPTGGVIALDIEPSLVPSNAEQRLVQGIRFESTVQFDDSELLELAPTAIEFPAEDAGVVMQARNHNNGGGVDLAPLDAAASGAETNEAAPDEAAPTGGDGPRASLKALSRLHQELVEQETALAPETLAEPPAEPGNVPVEVVDRASPVPEAIAETPVAGPEIVELTAEEPKPKLATDLFEISVKTFPPAKPVLVGGNAFPSNAGPLLPHLKFLPLRPKVALAPDYVPLSQVSAVSEATPAVPAAPVAPAAPAAQVRTPTPSKPPVAGKPAARLTQPKPPSQAAKPVQPAVKAPEPRAPVAPKPAAPKANATMPVAKPVAAEAAPTPEASAPRPNAAPAAPAEKPKPKLDQASKDNVPNFNIAQPASPSGFGSLKVKLGIAIVLLIVACVYFLGWGGGKPNKPTPSNASASDGSGPSIIMGEGGWVEDWAGDPSGMHAGRQITIYRPSLKLSDYRLEFEGSIDTKSVGWVFRAADPDNYYAMKLMTVANGLSPKVALFKYLVANGRQTQVGRVPIDLTVQQDTVFDVRVDVRGPQFTTYLQGQQVDSWTDDQLKTGGAGFLNERDERGKVKSVSIRYLSGAAGK